MKHKEKFRILLEWTYNKTKSCMDSEFNEPLKLLYELKWIENDINSEFQLRNNFKLIDQLTNEVIFEAKRN